MRHLTACAGLLLLATGVRAAPAHEHGTAPKPAAPVKADMCAKCAMCKEMKAKGGMMGGMTGSAPTVTVAADGTIVILRGNTLLKYDAGLKLVAQTELPAQTPVSAGHEHH